MGQLGRGGRRRCTALHTEAWRGLRGPSVWLPQALRSACMSRNGPLFYPQRGAAGRSGPRCWTSPKLSPLHTCSDVRSNTSICGNEVTTGTNEACGRLVALDWVEALAKALHVPRGPS
jgi:hypothetical protein